LSKRCREAGGGAHWFVVAFALAMPLACKSSSESATPPGDVGSAGSPGSAGSAEDAGAPGQGGSEPLGVGGQAEAGAGSGSVGVGGTTSQPGSWDDSTWDEAVWQ
jgi:hypothetical protein